MIVYPAIDIRNGKCVRLYQGDYALMTIYSDSPIDMAKQFLKEGAVWLHLVDLDGAKNPAAIQAELIKNLLKSVPLKIQVGGGIRTDEQIAAYLDAGASRVIVGSLAIESPETVLKWLQQYGPDKINLALDVFIEKGIPKVATQAWQKINDLALFDVIEPFLEYDLEHILCTDIQRDGVAKGPNVDLYASIRTRFPKLQLQASGGVSSLSDLKRLQEIGLSGAITGRALYERQINLTEALSCLL